MPRGQNAYRVPRAYGPKIVAIGGGHGLSNLLRGLKEYTPNISAIVTVADDGGGSGMLRQDLGMPPPGDIRNCCEALANTESVLKDLMHYRFTEGALAGQSFGNLLLAALNGISPSFDAAVVGDGHNGGNVGSVLFQAPKQIGKAVPAADGGDFGPVGAGHAIRQRHGD